MEEASFLKHVIGDTMDISPVKHFCPETVNPYFRSDFPSNISTDFCGQRVGGWAGDSGFRTEGSCADSRDRADESTDTSVVTVPESPSQQPVGIPLGNLPTMTTEADHLNTLELSLTEERVKTNRIENQLNRLLALLDPTGENAEPALPGEAPSVQAMDEDTPSEMNMGRGFQMRPSNPSDFDGD
ncbi:hypothetical protein M422DRAFT_249542 [Sphaerobolus stellatus SS14]|uniref:Uncharacterized protein n=1 Tax=Sphaerobolus stellatus (strain SS14) TaxID=990650 RepID=A0A0C9UUQ6_SPHS4|nr:hypothetical protein M422DRAFT_249542 [Sphaerobolus stellatus SS14]